MTDDALKSALSAFCLLPPAVCLLLPAVCLLAFKRRFVAARSYGRDLDHTSLGDNQRLVEIIDCGAHMPRDQVERLTDLRWIQVECSVDGQMLLAWLLRPQIRTAKYRAGRHTFIG